MSLLLPFLAFAVTAVLIMVLRPLAQSVGLVDVPTTRKSHKGNVPLIGGIAIFAALTSVSALQFVMTGALPEQFVALSVSSTLLVIVGIWDDFTDLPAKGRLIAQVIAALITVYGGGVMLTDLGNLSPTGSLLELGILSVPFTVFACLGIINAMNMCDGLDGLSGSLALISLLGLGTANALWGDPTHQYLIVLLSACVAGFLMFNLRTLWRSRAWVFLGDAGSMLLGLMLCWLSIDLSQGSDRVISPAAALWFLMLPIYDAVSMMLRRILKGQSPFAADREHLHHIFLLAGFSVGESVTLMSGIAVIGVMIGLGGTFFGVHDLVLAGFFLIGGGLYFWTVRRAWRVMRFLRRSICRRNSIDRRLSSTERRVRQDPAYAGPERRSGIDRRQLNRRAGD
ncbi:MAG: undecaprenyl/decaprenyl-phosphate alpha-N-acetylglucosaminyl 1-phosphate transferase [Gammaproteobacteria bacterium]|nr:undecaprenyl/decaprenyl-phosphate alpha-N-acetylglucosaminyl 1-phosphate transferase [Gammaproteobacteria bacterium]NND54463.1 undecaprenyl/decaprenyl-phosphate alpha-N-acetylglucosaminyl 1-phosphate transferase [Gammaproteobacteria bacterium]